MRLPRRTSTPVTALALAAVLFSTVTATASASTGTATVQPPVSAASAAATWMGAQLSDGDNSSGDQGLTADIVMALAAAGTGGATAVRATDWLAANATDYIDRGTTGRVFAGGTAKLALVAAVEHRDPADFGGHDLVATLLSRLQENGRFTDDLPQGDMSNQFTQSLAVLALERTGGAPVKAVDFLAASRCADGGYPLTFRSDPATCTSHTDSTGLAVQALLDAGRAADAAPALDWLEDHQLADGSFPDNGLGGTSGNSNSTALDVQALTAGGRTAAADRGLAWLRSMQLGCEAPSGDRGGVRYVAEQANGDLRATAQAAPALAGKPLADIDSTGSDDEFEPVICGAAQPVL